MELKAYKTYSSRNGDTFLFRLGEPDIELDDEDEVYLKDDADKVIAEKDKEIRRLKRAMYRACANWAHIAVAFFSSYKKKECWNKMERNCRAMAEKFK